MKINSKTIDESKTSQTPKFEQRPKIQLRKHHQANTPILKTAIFKLAETQRNRKQNF